MPVTGTRAFPLSHRYLLPFCLANELPCAKDVQTNIMRSIITIALLIAATAVAAEEKPGQRSPEPRSSGPSNTGGPGMIFGERTRRTRWSDGASSASMASFRQAIQSELKNVPQLEDKITRLMDIQQERVNLFRKRTQIAQKGGEQSGVALQQFHQVLKDEEALNGRQEKLMSEFAKDDESISQQIAARRAQIQDEIEKARNTRDSKVDVKSLQKIDRMYSVMQERMENLKENPEAGEWVRKFSRSFWHGGQDDLDPQLLEKVRHRVEQLQQDQESLRRRLTEIDDEMGELRDLLESSRSFRGRGPAPAPGTEPPPHQRNGHPPPSGPPPGPPVN
jgi:hypothetical protein